MNRNIAQRRNNLQSLSTINLPKHNNSTISAASWMIKHFAKSARDSRKTVMAATTAWIYLFRGSLYYPRARPTRVPLHKRPRRQRKAQELARYRTKALVSHWFQVWPFYIRVTPKKAGVKRGGWLYGWRILGTPLMYFWVNLVRRVLIHRRFELLELEGLELRMFMWEQVSGKDYEVKKLAHQPRARPYVPPYLLDLIEHYVRRREFDNLADWGNNKRVDMIEKFSLRATHHNPMERNWKRIVEPKRLDPTADRWEARHPGQPCSGMYTTQSHIKIIADLVIPGGIPPSIFETYWPRYGRWFLDEVYHPFLEAEDIRVRTYCAHAPKKEDEANAELSTDTSIFKERAYESTEHLLLALNVCYEVGKLTVNNLRERTCDKPIADGPMRATALPGFYTTLQKQNLKKSVIRNYQVQGQMYLARKRRPPPKIKPSPGKIPKLSKSPATAQPITPTLQPPPKSHKPRPITKEEIIAAVPPEGIDAHAFLDKFPGRIPVPGTQASKDFCDAVAEVCNCPWDYRGGLLTLRGGGRVVGGLNGSETR